MSVPEPLRPAGYPSPRSGFVFGGLAELADIITFPRGQNGFSVAASPGSFPGPAPISGTAVGSAGPGAGMTPHFAISISPGSVPSSASLTKYPVYPGGETPLTKYPVYPGTPADYFGKTPWKPAGAPDYPFYEGLAPDWFGRKPAKPFRL